MEEFHRMEKKLKMEKVWAKWKKEKLETMTMVKVADFGSCPLMTNTQ